MTLGIILTVILILFLIATRKKKDRPMMIYISHPFNNQEENKRKVEEIILGLVKEYPEHTFVSPIHAFSFMYDKVDYEQGLSMCLELLDRCDMCLVMGNWQSSRGCRAEVDYCIKNKIPCFNDRNEEII